MIVETDPIRLAEAKWLEAWGRGPSRLRWSELPVQVGDPAPDLRLPDSTGQEVALSSFWQDRPALFVFLRHFGCSCAFDRATRIRQDHVGLLAAGVTVVAIGQAEPARAARFAERQSLPCPVLCDPERVAYKAYGLLEGRPSQVVYGLPDAFLQRDPETGAAFQVSRRDTDRAVVDSPWQLPGDFLVGQDGRLRLTYRAQFCADFPDPDVLLAAAREAALGL